MSDPTGAVQPMGPGRAFRTNTPLRVLLAHDLSPPADRAAALVAATKWPPATIVRVVTSPVGLGMGISSFAGIREVRGHHRELRRSIDSAQEQIAADLVASGLIVEKTVAEAPPGDAIIEDAHRFGADLVVVGARKKGPIAAALLGSVSTQIMDGAPCSVLVSRGPPVERVLLATDGSMPARLAVDIVANWPLFASAQIRVLGISAPPPRYAGLVLSPAEMSTVQHDAARASRATTDGVVGEAVDLLTAKRRSVEGKVRIGEPHTQIVAAAREWRADLVVIGATGQSPLRSILLGSVARRLLHRVSASVLVARPEPSGDGAVPASDADGDHSR